MKKLPSINLNNIYPSVDSKEFLEDIEKVEIESKNLIEDLNSYQADSSFNKYLRKVIDLYNDIYDRYETLMSFTEIKTAMNTADKKCINSLNLVEGKGAWVAKVSLAFSKFLSNNKTLVEKSLTSDQFSDYEFVLKEAIEDYSHTMGDDLEALAYQMSLSGAESWSRLQTSLSSSAATDFRGAKKTVIELRTLATSPDREVRKEAYEKELEVWDTHKNAFAASLNGVKGSCITLDKLRKWDSPLERSVTQSRINMKVLDALISTLEKNLSIFTPYFDAKAKALGLKKLAFFDLFAPIGKNTKRWEYEDTKAFIIKQYSAFNPAQGEFVKNAFNHNWIDPEARPNKTGGAFDIYFPEVKESRVFANYDYTYDSVATLGHELGHAWHDHIVSKEEAIERNYPMTLAETASIFGEFIIFQGAVAEAETEEERLNLIESFLQGASQVCVDILCRFYFEKELFKRREQGELVPDELSKIMLDCQKKTYGKGLDPKYMHKYMWAVKGHYYSQDFSYYNYPYAFGQLFGLGLYKVGTEEKSSTPFYEKFNKMLSLTGKQSAVTVAASVGCDIENPAFWQGSMDMIQIYINEFKAIVDKVK